MTSLIKRIFFGKTTKDVLVVSLYATEITLPYGQFIKQLFIDLYLDPTDDIQNKGLTLKGTLNKDILK